MSRCAFANIFFRACDTATKPKVAVTIVAAPKPEAQSIRFGPSADALHCADAAVRLRVTSASVEKTQSTPSLPLLFFTTPNWLFRPLAQFGRQRILDGLRQVSDLDLRWVNLTTAPPVVTSGTL